MHVSSGMPQIFGIKETALSVTDVSRSAQFYHRVFGFRTIDENERLCALSVADSHVLLLFKRGETANPVETPGGLIPPHHATGESHVAFAISTEEIQPWRQRLQELEIPLESTVTWPRGGTSLYFRDPDGHLLELVTPGIWAIY